MIFGSYIVNYTNDYSGKAVQKKTGIADWGTGPLLLAFWLPI